MPEATYVLMPSREMGQCKANSDCNKPAAFIGQGHTLCAAHFAMLCIHHFATTVDHMPHVEADAAATRIVNLILQDWVQHA